MYESACTQQISYPFATELGDERWIIGRLYKNLFDYYESIA
jgi:hypothetical protein